MNISTSALLPCYSPLPFYSQLVDRSNKWLTEKNVVRLVGCESVPWTGLSSKSIHNEQSSYERSLTADTNTRHQVILR